MNFESVKLDNGKILDEQGKELGTLLEFLESFSDLVASMKMELTNYTSAHTTPTLRKDLKKSLENVAEEYFTKFFKEKGEATPIEIDKAANQLIKEYSDYGDELHEEILKSIESKLSKNKVNGGDNMFKSLKEARNFTAHLDALANEIEGLDGVSNEMRKHLAFRLDRLSDLIENSMSKEAAVEKEANGMGNGAWAYDADEARYMSTMGGTGVLEGDADEKRYMAEFNGDDHREVLERKENMDINGAGKKVKQPSDDYKEAPVANNLRSTILKVLNKK